MHRISAAIESNRPFPATGRPPLLSIARWGDRRYLEVAQVIGLSRWDLIRHVILPQLLRTVWANLRLSPGNTGWAHVDTRPT
jgi:ABC-type molybdate transport system permease subunit